MIVNDPKGMRPEDALIHFGVKGMQWGIRKGKSKTGVGRIRAASAQSLMDESRRRNTVANPKRAGFVTRRAYGALRGSQFNVPGAIVGGVRTASSQRTTARRQQAAAKRVLAGKTTASDLMRVLRNVTVADLIIKTSIKPGATGYDGTRPGE